MTTLQELNFLTELLQQDANAGLDLVHGDALDDLHHADVELLDLLDECSFVDWRAPPTAPPPQSPPQRQVADVLTMCTPPRPAQRSRTKRPVDVLSPQDYRRKSKKVLFAKVQTSGMFCQCKKSRCLKKYCDCFAAGKACGALCGCQDCHNFSDTAIKAKPDFCSCSRNGCATGYCVCRAAGRSCGHKCRCTGCKNCSVTINVD